MVIPTGQQNADQLAKAEAAADEAAAADHFRTGRSTR